MNYRRVDAVNNAVAKTLMARDSKGFGTGFETQNAVTGNGVLEWQE